MNMQQLTVFASPDLEHQVVSALDRAGAEGYFRAAGASANKFNPEGEVPRVMTWAAVMFVVPAAPNEVIKAIVKELEEYAGACEVEPCLRMVVTAVQEAS